MEFVKIQHETGTAHRLIDPNTFEGFDTDENGIVSVPEYVAGYEPSGDDPGAGALAGPWKRLKGDPSPYAGWKKDALIEEADRRGLDSSGKVADLTARLEAFDEAAAAAKES